MMTAIAVAEPAERWKSGAPIVACIAAMKFVFHMATATLYGFFIDEITSSPAGSIWRGATSTFRR